MLSSSIKAMKQKRRSQNNLNPGGEMLTYTGIGKLTLHLSLVEDQGARAVETLRRGPKGNVSNSPHGLKVMSSETERDRLFFASPLAGEQKRRGNILADKIRSQSRIPHSKKHMPTLRQAQAATHLGSLAHTGRGFHHQSAFCEWKRVRPTLGQLARL